MMTTDVKFEMNPMKRLQMLFSWSEFYFANKRKEQYDKINVEIAVLRDDITNKNTNFKK